MKPNLKIRKPIDKLTIADFDTHPVWVYASDEESTEGQDETTVKPLKNIRTASIDEPVHISCDFLFGGGQAFRGFATLMLDSPMPSGAVVLRGRKYLFLPSSLKKAKGGYFDPAIVPKRCRELGITPADLDHVIVRLRVLERGADSRISLKGGLI